MTPFLPGLLAIFLYLFAGILLTARLLRGDQDAGCLRNQILMLGLAAAVIHALILYRTILTDEGLNLGIFYAASLVAMTAALLLVLASFIEPVDNLGIAVFPIAAVCIGLTLVFPEPHIVSNPVLVGRIIPVCICLFSKGDHVTVPDRLRCEPGRRNYNQSHDQCREVNFFHKRWVN